jgi:hypothetical protein
MFTKRMWLVVLVASTVLLAIRIGLRFSDTALALSESQAGETIPYAGRLASQAGGPVTDGVYDFTFTLYDAETDGTLLWSETQTGVTVKGGAFVASLGSVIPLSKEALVGSNRWLAVSVRGPGEKAFSALTPRQRLSAASPARPSAGPACAHDHWGETWSGSSTGLQMTNAGGQRAVLLFSTWAGTIGVYGDADVGVSGNSTNGFGIVANGKDASGADSGDVALGGDYGEIVASGEQLNIYSGGNASVYLDTNGNSNSQFEIWSTNAWPGVILTVKENGDLWAAGTKSAMVKTANYGQRLLYATESPDVWFEDFGSASLVNGEATVTFEPVFAETINPKVGYHAFLTPVCQESVSLFVTAKSDQGFTVRGVALNGQPSSCAFDYRVVAKRLGYEGVRLEPVTVDESGSK